MNATRAAATLIFLFGISLIAQGKKDGQWPSYLGDLGGDHYSSLAQINKTNVQKLQVAWTWKIGEVPTDPPIGSSPHKFEATPLMIDDVLYFPTAFHHVIALDAKTGKQLWDFNSHVYDWGPGASGYVYAIQRGLATWTDGKQMRVILAARGHLFEIDAKTGAPIQSFGDNGDVDMTTTLIWKLVDRTHYVNTSPPAVYKNVIIMGSSTPDNTASDDPSPPGDIQAFDVVTGKHLWSFHTIPQKGEFGNDTWEDNSWTHVGHANVWPPISIDEKRGLVYLSVTEPANNSSGVARPGNTLFGDTILCLDALTGKRVWHFQTVHHDIWDYDGAMGSNLVTIHVNGKTIEAVASVSKQGFIYVFDRVTGEPVWPIEERPVAQSDIPGEKTSPTQPFPTKPPAFAKQGFQPEDVIDLTPEIKAMALDKLKGYRFGPIFTPQSKPPASQGTLQLPSYVGGAEWGGSATDPLNGVLYVHGDNLINRPLLGEGATMLHVNKPPWGTITAIDLNKGEIVWQEPDGDMPGIRDNPLLKGVNFPPTGAFSRTGPLVTAGGLVFTGPEDEKLYARDKDTGKLLWTAGLQNDVTGNPMTYVTSSGKQYIVVAVSRGGDKPGNGKEATLVAFSLP